MELQLSNYQHFSSNVRLELRAAGQSFDLAGVGRNELIPRHGIELEPCVGEVHMNVDGQIFIWPVRLEHGSVPFDDTIPVQKMGEVQRHYRQP